MKNKNKTIKLDNNKTRQISVQAQNKQTEHPNLPGTRYSRSCYAVPRKSTNQNKRNKTNKRLVAI